MKSFSFFKQILFFCKIGKKISRRLFFFQECYTPRFHVLQECSQTPWIFRSAKILGLMFCQSTAFLGSALVWAVAETVLV